MVTYEEAADRMKRTRLAKEESRQLREQTGFDEYAQAKRGREIGKLERKRFLIKMLGGQCNRCGYKKNTDALDFHHIDPRNKLQAVSTMLHSQASFEAAKYEAKKCELLCANCHREHHCLNRKKLLPRARKFQRLID